MMSTLELKWSFAPEREGMRKATSLRTDEICLP